MKILLIGNREHQLLFNLVYEINRSKKDITFDILSQDSNIISDENRRYYNDITTLDLPKLLLKNRFIRGIAKQITFRSKLKKEFNKDYDYVHIHYIEDIILRDVNFLLKSLKSKLVISVWGSDFLRADIANREKMRLLFRKCEKITISNALVIDAFKDYYRGEAFCDRVVMLKFFVKPLDDLIVSYKREQHNEAKQKLGIDISKLVLTIGYNASRMQQHELILETLFQHNEFISNYKEKLHLVLPLTYPKDKEYIDSIKLVLDKSGFTYSLFTEFLSNSELLRLRYCSDVFVQLQTTDMMSGSMLEYLCLGNTVVTGSWLPYQELLDEGMIFETIESISCLPEVLVKKVGEDFKRIDSNQEVVKKLFGKELLINNWIKVYD